MRDGRSNEYLSPKQTAVLDFLKKHIREKGYPPSVREICDGVGLNSTSTVQSHLNSLEDKGRIRRTASRNRSIEILDQAFSRRSGMQEIFDIPIVGKVAAGEPIFADENVEDFFTLPLQYFDGSENYFMLRVQGDSMIEVGINDRDMIIVRKQSHAKNGDIVVALVEDSATVKTFYKEKGHYRLQPENKYYSPIIVDEVMILGAVCGLFRVYR